MRKITIFTFSLLALLILGITYFKDPNNEVIEFSGPENRVYQCIYKSHYSMYYFQAQSMKNYFEVRGVTHSPANCINPNLPAIHIKTQNPRQNAWLQIVYTDSKNHGPYFIDSANSDKHPDIYPFYSKGKDFYDAPLWSYSALDKPLSYWKAHTWAVEVDYKNKTIRPIGGISWGFGISYFYYYPTALDTQPLEEKDWQQDQKIFEKELKFNFIEFYNTYFFIITDIIYLTFKHQELESIRPFIKSCSKSLSALSSSLTSPVQRIFP